MILNLVQNVCAIVIISHMEYHKEYSVKKLDWSFRADLYSYENV